MSNAPSTLRSRSDAVPVSKAVRTLAGGPEDRLLLVRIVSISDTLGGERRELEPREAGDVGIYACGPTVYGRIHIGNARPYVVFTLLKRFLEHEGYGAKLVINVTDVNDKIYDAAREEGVPSAGLAHSAEGTPSPLAAS